MSQLPDELVCHIFNFIVTQTDIKTIHSLLSVCQRWKSIMEDDESSCCLMNIWKRFCLENRWIDDDEYEQQHNMKSSYKSIYRNAWIKNKPIPSKWLESNCDNARNILRLYARKETGIYIRSMTSQYQQPGKLRYHSNIPIRRPYILEYLSGYDNDNCGIPEHVNWYIPNSLTYDPIINRYPCPKCNDTKQEKNLIFIFHYDKSHDWGTDVEYQCENCKCYLYYCFYSGA